MEYQPRYALYLKINPSPKNWEYINWISEMSSKYKTEKGVLCIFDHDDFTKYIEIEVDREIASQKQMRDRVNNGLDPLTGEKMEAVGKISTTKNGCVDGTGRRVKLNAKGTWIYA